MCGGDSEEFLQETESSLHESITIVERMIKNNFVVTGIGSIETELSKMLRDYSCTVAGKEQMLIGAIAKALEIIPRQLCDDSLWNSSAIKLDVLHAAVETTCSILSKEDTIETSKFTYSLKMQNNNSDEFDWDKVSVSLKNKKSILPTRSNFKKPISKNGFIKFNDFLIIFLNNEKYRNVIKWIDYSTKSFVIFDPKKISSLWGETKQVKKNAKVMTYDKFSRALRYGYVNNTFAKIQDKKHAYRFI